MGKKKWNVVCPSVRLALIPIADEKKFVRLSYFIPNRRGEKKFVRLSYLDCNMRVEMKSR